MAGLDQLTAGDLLAAISAADAGVRTVGLRLAGGWLDREARILERALDLAADDDEAVALQVALTLGDSRDERIVRRWLAWHAPAETCPWMDAAILSSLSGRGSQFLAELLTDARQIGQARGIVGAAVRDDRRRPRRRRAFRVLVALVTVEEPALRVACLKGLRSSFSSPAELALSEPAVKALKAMVAQSDPAVSTAAARLVQILKLETPAERSERLAGALQGVADIQLSVEARLAAVAELAIENDPTVTEGLLAAVAISTPQVRDAILAAVFSHSHRLADVLAAIETKILPVAVLSAVQRTALLEHPDPQIRAAGGHAGEKCRQSRSRDFCPLRRRAQGQARPGPRRRTVPAELRQMPPGPRSRRGRRTGSERRVPAGRGDDSARHPHALQRAITSGYVTYVVATSDGRIITGLLASEAANSVSIRQPEGKTEAILRKDIDQIKASTVSLMPDNLTANLSPQDVADILAWIRTRREVSGRRA